VSVECEYAAEREVRLAVVLYGGVSLAVYMYGVAQELYHLVRATAPSRPPSESGVPPTGLAFPQAESTEAVYRKLARLLPQQENGVADASAGPVRTRFVVDILSGTSAGGINGICLAKAIANESDFRKLKKIWLDEGGFENLLNDEESEYYREPPSSLLGGRQMLANLVRAIRSLSRSDVARSRMVDELDLWVTATDLEGLPFSIRLANGTPTERRHANRYRFRYCPAENVNQLAEQMDGFIAYAARSTSSFPFAFDPPTLDHLVGLASIPNDAWMSFYTAYATADPPFRGRAFSDGGILDNKPFTYATDTLLSRRATLPVDRKLVYIEPSPEAVPPPPPRASWDALATTHAALLHLPRLDTIRQDIQALLARNRAIERAREVIAEDDGDPPGEASGVARDVYRRLRIRGTVDYVAELMGRTMGADSDSDDALAWHYIARAWKERCFGDDLDDFLRAFDVPRCLRRLDFVLQRIKEAEAATPGGRPDLRELRAWLADRRHAFQVAEQALSSRSGALAEALGSVGREQLLTVLAERSDAEMLAKATQLLDDVPVDMVTTELQTRLLTPMTEDAANRLPKATPDEMVQAYQEFHAYDSALYLVQFGTPIGETNSVDILRISPADEAGPGGPKGVLYGTRLMNFGAFFDVEWRQHDIVWGRLNGAACLIRALLPEDPQADTLILDAYRHIIREYREEFEDTGQGDDLTWFLNHAPSDPPDETRTAAALSRGAIVATRMAEALLPKRRGAAVAARLLAELRGALKTGDDGLAVAAVRRAIWSSAWAKAAATLWIAAVMTVVLFFLLGDGWVGAALVLVGVCVTLAGVATAVNVIVGKQVRAALARGRRMAYKAIASKRSSDQQP
jgi:predicted acylesterase/phospholipase RssA